MKRCDVCNRVHDDSALVTVDNGRFRRGVNRSVVGTFDPFELGLIDAAVRAEYNLAAPAVEMEPFELWRQAVVEPDRTPWSLCPDCLEVFVEAEKKGHTANRGAIGCIVAIAGIIAIVVGIVFLVTEDGNKGFGAALLVGGLAGFGWNVIRGIQSVKKARLEGEAGGETAGPDAAPSSEQDTGTTGGPRVDIDRRHVIALGEHYFSEDDQRLWQMGAAYVEWPGRRPSKVAMDIVVTCHQCGTEISGHGEGYPGFMGAATDPCEGCGNQVEVGHWAAWERDIAPGLFVYVVPYTTSVGAKMQPIEIRSLTFTTLED